MRLFPSTRTDYMVLNHRVKPLDDVHVRRAISYAVDRKALKAGEEVQLPGFGKFYVREQKAREGKNPQTGERMQIEARKVPAFKAGKALKESV
jgi:nucleoid DNA-binding protein